MQQQQPYPPAHPYGYQPAPPPPKKKSRFLWWTLGLVVGALMVCGFVGSRVNAAHQEIETYRATQNAEQAVQISWLASVRSNCNRYKVAPNEIKKSEIFNENEALLKDASFSGVRGVLKTLSTNQGGAELRLVVQVGDAEFKTETLFAPIKRGTPVYEAASNMREGQCVTVSADKVESASMVEQSKVCSLDYFASFTELKPCG